MFKVSKSGRVSFKMSFFTNNPSLFVFSNEELEKMADLYRNDYDNGKPFPSLIIDDFLPFKVARQVLKVFPSENDKFWLDWTKRDTLHQPKKQGVGHALRLEGVDPYLHHILAAFNSFPFLNFLEKLTGIKYLLSDPYFHGGGIHHHPQIDRKRRDDNDDHGRIVHHQLQGGELCGSGHDHGAKDQRFADGQPGLAKMVETGQIPAEHDLRRFRKKNLMEFLETGEEVGAFKIRE